MMKAPMKHKLPRAICACYCCEAVVVYDGSKIKIYIFLDGSSFQSKHAEGYSLCPD